MAFDPRYNSLRTLRKSTLDQSGDRGNSIHSEQGRDLFPTMIKRLTTYDTST